MYRFILSIMLCLMFISVPAMAQQEAVAQDGKVVVDLKTLNEISSTAVGKVLKAIEKEEQAAQATKEAAQAAKEVVPKVEEVIEKIDPDKFQKYVDTIVSGVTKLCKGLGVAVNDFIKTEVGMILTALIVYNCGGNEMISSLWGIIGGIGFWIIGMAVVLYFFRHFFGNKKVYDIEYAEESGKKIKENVRLEKIYDFDSDDARSGVGACIGIAAALITIVALCLVF